MFSVERLLSLPFFPSIIPSSKPKTSSHLLGQPPVGVSVHHHVVDQLRALELARVRKREVVRKRKGIGPSLR